MEAVRPPPPPPPRETLPREPPPPPREAPPPRPPPPRPPRANISLVSQSPMTVTPIANKIFFFMAAPVDRLCLEGYWIAINNFVLGYLAGLRTIKTSSTSGKMSPPTAR
jgi:hypothetical protein